MAHQVINRPTYLRRMRASLPAWMTDNGITAADVEWWFDPENPDGASYAVNDNVGLAGSKIPGGGTVYARQSFVSSQPFMREVSGSRVLSFEGDDYMEFKDSGGSLNVSNSPEALILAGSFQAADVTTAQRIFAQMPPSATAPQIFTQIRTGNFYFEVRDSDGVRAAPSVSVSTGTRYGFVCMWDQSASRASIWMHDGSTLSTNDATGSFTGTIGGGAANLGSRPDTGGEVFLGDLYKGARIQTTISSANAGSMAEALTTA